MQPSVELVPAVSPDQVGSLVPVLDRIRAGGASTRSELIDRTGLGRAAVALRVAQLLSIGLVDEGSLGPSTGGRAPRQLRFRAEVGRVLVAELGATGLSVGLTDLAGRLLDRREEAIDVADGPDGCLGTVERLFVDLLNAPGAQGAPLWGIGIGVPGPVEFATGRPISPPIMPGWDNYPIRDRFAARFDVAVWVDNEVNLMALGELRAGLAVGERDVVYVKIGTGIGAGVISAGRLHRGAQGCAGDIGHVAVHHDERFVCRCGNTGCLEALAGGAALARDAETAARDRPDSHLGRRLAERGRLTAADVADAARHGDPVSFDLLNRAGRLIGEVLATLVNFFNPSLILLGGGVTAAGDMLLAVVRESVYRRSLPLATRDLRLARSPLADVAGLVGAAHMVTDELFSRATLPRWTAYGTPAGHPELTRPDRPMKAAAS